MQPLLQPERFTLTAFEIENAALGQVSSDLKSRIIKKWADSKIALDRKFSTSDNDSAEYVLSNFFTNVDNPGGLVLKITPSEETGAIPASFLNSKSLVYSDLNKEVPNSEGESSFTILSRFYFMLTDRFLVTTLPNSRCKVLMNYLNKWLMMEETPYKITPLIQKPQDFDFSDISQIIVEGDYPVKVGKRRTHTLKQNALNIFKKQNISFGNKFDEKNLVSAELILKFKKPQKMSIEEYQRELSASIKPLADLDHVKFRLADNRMIGKDKILYTKKVVVKRFNNIEFDDPGMFGEMRDFIKTLPDA